MYANKDESERCLEIAKKYILENNNRKALDFLYKSNKLFPSKEAEDLIERLVEIVGDDHKASNKEKRRSKSFEEERTQNENNLSNRRNGTTTNIDYTNEQIQAVERIRTCKNYYEILNVTKNATDAELKKQYRKLALQFHPDKNKAPGTSEAFKAISNAFMVLIDPVKRRNYDLHGSEDEQSRINAQSSSFSNQRFYEYSDGFDRDMTAEELFNMFFNTSNFHIHRRNRYRERRPSNSSQQDVVGYSVVLHFLPIVFFVFLSLIGSFFVSEPVYSLTRVGFHSQLQNTKVYHKAIAENNFSKQEILWKYQIERKTEFGVLYYVKENFDKSQSSLSKIERQVNEDYIRNLRNNCFKENNYRHSMIMRAQRLSDRQSIKTAQNLQTPSCQKLQQLEEVGDKDVK